MGQTGADEGAGLHVLPTCSREQNIRVQFRGNMTVGNKVYVPFKFYSQCALSLSYITAT